MKFFSPTTVLKELLLLQHIEKNPNTTQKEIAEVIDGATSMVNVYIDNLESNGYLTRAYQSLKIVKYNITPEGLKRKNYLAITYFHELLKLYNMAEESIEKFLICLEHKGYKNILFYGAGEVAQIMLGVIKNKKDISFKISGVIDDNEDLIGEKILGYKILHRNKINEIHHDGIVITSYTYEDEIKKKLEEIGYPEDKVERFFTE